MQSTPVQNKSTTAYNRTICGYFLAVPQYQLLSIEIERRSRVSQDEFQLLKHCDPFYLVYNLRFF